MAYWCLFFPMYFSFIIYILFKLLAFSSMMSDLLLIISRIFFTSDIHSFLLKQFPLGLFFVFSVSLFNIFLKLFEHMEYICYNTFLSLSANSVIYRIFFFAFLMIFLLDVRHIFIPINTFGFCSGKQLNYLETIWSFQTLLLSFLCRNRKTCSLRLSLHQS